MTRHFFILVLVNLMWAFQFSGAKIATEQLGPITVTFLPLALSTLLLLPWALLNRRRRPAGGPGLASTWPQFLLLGTVGTIASQLGLTWGVERSLASNAAVLTLTIPVLTAVLAAMLLGERMTALRWVSFVLAIGGVLLVSDIDWRSVNLTQSRFLLGNVLIFVSCFGSAFINSYSKKLLESFSAAEVLVYSFFVADVVLFALIAAFEPDSLTRLAAIGGGAWLSLLLIALFSLSISMVLFFIVLEKIDATQASLSIYLLPVFGVLISAVTVGERITWNLILGGSLVFVSTFLVTTYEERMKAKEFNHAEV
jgi:drug/metabolite transporter (DMT)-like permease